MKVVILAGGLGTRISEESEAKPKPMIEIGGKPIIWHVMKTYAQHGLHDFIICCGYKGYQIKEFFANYFLHTSDVTFDLAANTLEVHRGRSEPWKVTLVDTGLSTMTGGRVKRVSQYVTGDTFCLTYGDGLADVNIRDLLVFHQSHGKLVTVTATHAPGRFGILELESSKVTRFREKPTSTDSLISAGFFVMSTEVFRYIDGDSTVFENQPLEKLAEEGHVQAYLHDGFFQPMDTLRDKRFLESLWDSNTAPWKVW